MIQTKAYLLAEDIYDMVGSYDGKENKLFKKIERMILKYRDGPK